MCNTSTSKTTRSSSKPVSRLLRWLSRDEKGNGIIEMRITFEKRSEIHRYFLTRLTSDFGTAFRLEKIGDDASCTDGEIYAVCIDGTRSTCECKGFLRWGHCKHVDACTAITARETKPTVKPTTTPAPRRLERCEAPIV